MSKKEVFKEIEKTLGLVPEFFEKMPESSLKAEWDLFRYNALKSDSPLNPKTRELIGISAAAARLCWYCVNFHSALARLHGATEEEIEDTISLSRFGGSWSTFLNGIDYDHELFLKELKEIGQYLGN